MLGPMSEPALRVLLIDLDNCPRQIAALPQSLAEYARVIGCHGAVEPKVSLALVPLLASAIQAGKLELVNMKRPGKNAADFGLAFWAGCLSSGMPADTEFDVLSQDSDLDHVVDLLRAAGRKAQRSSGAQAAFNGPTAAGLPDVAKSCEEYRARVLKTEACRPVKRARLLNSITAYFQFSTAAAAEEILRALIQRKVVSIDANGKVQYS